MGYLMKTQAVLFVDVDETEQTRYFYREPHFIAARKLGYHCLIAARKNRSYTERLYADSDAVFLIDAIDENSIIALMDKLSHDYDVRILFCYSGQATRHGQTGVIVANACQKLGLIYSSPDGIDACNNKFIMRKRLAAHGVNSVRYGLCHNEEQLLTKANEIGFPLIAKPPFGAGSAFIKKCSTEKELLQHYATYQQNYSLSFSADFFGGDIQDPDCLNIPGHTILLESWIEGVEGTVECVVKGNAVYPLIINEKLILTEGANTVLENLLITPPVSFTSSEQAIIREYAVSCLRAVGLTNAIAHLEFRMSADGPVLIEINPRLGGLYVSSAFRDTAGICPWTLYLDILSGQTGVVQRLEGAALQAINCSQYYSMMAFYPDKKGIFKGFSDLSIIHNNPDVSEHGMFPPGSLVNPDLEEFYLLKCWVRVESAEAARSLYEEIAEHVIPVIE